MDTIYKGALQINPLDILLSDYLHLQTDIEDVINAEWIHLIACLLTAMVPPIILTFLMHWIAAPLFWMFIGGVHLFLFYRNFKTTLLDLTAICFQWVWFWNYTVDFFCF